MKFFIDTANLDEIREAAELGILDGVTTNPSLVAKEKYDISFKELIREICKIVPGPVSAEVVSTDVEGMMNEAHDLAKIASNVVVKIPLLKDGLKAVKRLKSEGIKTNVTLCFLADTGASCRESRRIVYQSVHRKARRYQPRRDGACRADSYDIQKLCLQN